MKYVGSKNKLSKELVPIIQSYISEKTKYYIEPFVGGANMIDKIKCKNKMGCDIHRELVEMWKALISGWTPPKEIDKEEYLNVKDNKDQYNPYYVGWIGFTTTYNAKYFGGYAGVVKTKDGTYRNYYDESRRNILKQINNIRDVSFHNKHFLDIPTDKLHNCVIYCDPPYRNTTKYKTEEFPYDEFYDWCRSLSKNNVVLISEYSMPEDFKCIWQKEHKTTLDKNKHQLRTERLFTL